MRHHHLTSAPTLLVPLVMLLASCGGRDAPEAPLVSTRPAISNAYAPLNGVVSALRTAVRVEQPGSSGATSAQDVALPPMQGPHPYWASVSATIEDAGATAGAAGRSVQAGTITVARDVFAGHIQESGPRSLFLLEIPITFSPQPHFARPLRGLTARLRLSDHPEWSLVTIPSLGFVGLRHGPLPFPGGSPCYYFEADELGAAASMAGATHQALWPIAQSDQVPVALSNRLFAVILAPQGSHGTAVGVIGATLRFSPGDEGVVTTPESRITITLGSAGAATSL